MKYEDWEYINFDPFEGDKDDCGIKCRTVKMVKTRKEHMCHFDLEHHIIPKGTTARLEKGILDGHWATWYACTDCMDKWFDEIWGEE